MAGPSPSQEQQRYAIGETVRLVGDLSDALGTQLRRAVRLSGELPLPASTGVNSAMVDDAARIKQHYAQLCDELNRLGALEPQARLRVELNALKTQLAKREGQVATAERARQVILHAHRQLQDRVQLLEFELAELRDDAGRRAARADAGKTRGLQQRIMESDAPAAESPAGEEVADEAKRSLAQLEARADALQAAQRRAEQRATRARADGDEMAERLREAETARDDAVRISEDLTAARDELQQQIDLLARRSANAEEQAARARRAWADSEAARQAERQASQGSA
ncbi:MAG: hypothetical protein DLM61_03845 [Pseudonocardiales bacterium]|nr:MAG: hypothetical protein DLM61_03845 [Pseudonocardiales bacterium]